MGRYKNGLLGEFQGGVGPVVGASWKGIPYMRARQKKTFIPRSKKQLAQQAKFSLLQTFLLSMRRVLMLGFNNSAIKMTGINQAYSYNYQHAITGEYPAFGLDYSKILVSAGQLLCAAEPMVKAEGGGKISFTWVDNSAMPMANANDRSMIVVYCPEKNHAAYVTDGGVRSSGTHQIDAGIFPGMIVETWLAFAAADGSDVATSVYTGRLTVL